MKKQILSTLGVATLGLVTYATTFMRVELFDGSIVKFAVDDVRQVDYVDESTSTDTIPVLPTDTVPVLPLDTTIKDTTVKCEYVDLGLPSGIKWATFNIGATAPEEYGDYFAWGETVAKKNFTWSNYKYATTDSTGNLESLLKYNSSDSLRTLLLEDDAAAANWGKGWRTPSQAEWNELVEYCTATEEYVNGVRGKLFTSKFTGKSIFIPFAGYYRENKLDKNKDYSYLWSSNVDNAGEDVGDNAAARMYLNAAVETWGDVCRAFGFSVRPVYVNDTISVVIPADTTVIVPADTTVIVPVDTTVIAPVDTASVNPEYVDLGLPSGIKWATTNIGATTPEAYGSYFAWGETEAKTNFTWSNYKYATTDSTGNLESLLKYNSSDSLRTLLLEDDAAAANWGKGWRTPSQAEWNELVEYCTATEEYVNGVRGKLFTSKFTGKSIFIPFAGYYRENKLDKNKDYSYLWSSNVDNAGEDVGDDAAARMYLNAAVETWGDVCRAFGFSVRPVYDSTLVADVDTFDYVDLGLKSGILWATTNIGAATPEEYGSYFAWGETEAKTNFTWSNYKYATTDSTGNLETLLKYNSSDSLRTLLPEDDAATANWGKAWRTPTQADWNELVANCTATEEYVNGVRGKLFVSKINNNSIFIPFAGYYRENKLDKNKDYSYLWSSNVDNAGEDVGDDAAARMYLNAAVETWGDVCRAFGFSVRPVRDVKR